MAESRIEIRVQATGAEQAAKVLADVAKSGAQIGSIVSPGIKKAEDALTSFGGTAKRVLEIFAGFTLGNITAQIASFAQRSVVELTRMGLENQRVEESFTRMAKSVGANAEALSESLRRASGGIADANDTMLASSKAMAQGLNSEQLVKIMETARAQATLAGTTVAEAFNQITESVTTLQVRQLRSFGIVIDLQKAYADYARALGVTAEQLTEVGQRAALLQAIDEQTRKNRAALTEGERTNAQEIERAKAIWSDFFATLAGGFATAYAGSVKWGARFLEQVTIEKQRIDELGVSWANYLAARLKGTGLEPQTRTSAADMQALRDIGDAATNMSQSLPTLSGHTKALTVDFKALAAEAARVAEAIQKGHVAAAEAVIAETEQNLKLELELTNQRLAEEKKALDDSNAGWVKHAEAINQNELDRLAGELAITNQRLAEEKKALDDSNAGWVAHAEAVIAGTEQELEAIVKINAPLRAYQDTLEEIALKGKLLGPSFDTLAPTISAVTAEIVRLGAAGKDVTALQEKLAGLKQVQELKGIFTDVFSSISSAISTSIQGVILGTQTMAQAFKNLWQSIVLSFVNSGIQRLLKGLEDWLFGSGSGAGSGGGGIIGGLATVFGTGSAVGQSGGIGTADITRGRDGGINSAGFAPGEAGGSPWSSATSTVGAFTTGLQAATGGTSTFTNVLAGITTGWETGVGVAGGVTGAISGGYQALSTALAASSTLTVALAGVGAAVAAFGSIMDTVNGELEAGIGGLVGGALVGAVGAYFAGPIGAFIGYAIGDLVGSWIGGLFGGGPSNYELKRLQAADEAAMLVGGVNTRFVGAARSGTAADTLAALVAGQAPGGSTPNPLRTDLSLPPALAEQLGLAAKAEIENGKAIIHWADVTQAQFNELIALFKADPSMIATSIIGKGDVSYLTPDQVATYTAALEQGAEALLTAFTAFESVRASINGLAEDILAAASELMPADLAGQLADYIVNPIRQSMLALLQDPTLSVEELQTSLDEMGQTLKLKVESWGKFADAIQAGKLIDAMLPTGDLAARMRAAMVPAYDAVIAAMRTGTAEQARLAVEFFAKQTALWGALGQAVTQAIDVEGLLPEDLGARFEARMRPAYDRILATLESGNLHLADAQIAAFNRQVAAWASLGQTVTRITTELGDLDGSIAAVQRMQAAMDAAVDRAKVAWDAAISSGDVERIATTSAAYHDATLARLQAEREMVLKIEEAINAVLAQAGTLVEMVTAIAQHDITALGDFGTITALLSALQGMAETASTAAQQLFAVDAALKAIIAVLPTAIEKFGPMQSKEDWLAGGMQTAAQLRAGGPSQITGAVTTAAAPFLAVQQGAIANATGDAKLALLQQQAVHLNALAGAAIAGINQWAEQAIAGARAAADAVLAGLATQRDAALAVIDKQIEGLQRSAEIQRELRAAEMDALRAQIAAAEEFAAAVKSMGEFIQALKVGPLGPGNPADKAQLAQGNFEQALAAFNRAPTAGGLTDLQDLAQTMLTQQEAVLSKPSPAFQTLSATTIKQLEAAKALGAAQVTDSEVLKQQLAALVELDKEVARSTQQQLDALDAQKTTITNDFETQTEAIEAAFRTQQAAIEKAAKDEIAGISAGLAAVLKENAAQQAPLIAASLSAQTTLLEAVTRGTGSGLIDGVAYLATRQDVAIGILEQIRTGIGIAIGQPLASGADRVTEGLYHLHDGEMVIPRSAADRIRSAANGAGLPDPSDLGSISNIVENWNTLSPSEQQAYTAAYHAADPATQQALSSSAAAAAAYTSAGANTGAYAPGSGDPLRDPWMAHAFQRKDGTWLFEPGYGPGAAKGSVVKLSTAPAVAAAPMPGTSTPTAPVYVPPGPGWLTSAGGASTPAMSGGGAMVMGGGDVQIIIQLDGKEIGRHGLAAAEISARRGTIHQIIVETKAK